MSLHILTTLIHNQITTRFYLNLVSQFKARELTGLQSILQNQVEEMGNHFFKEGAKVIPGDLTYVKDFYGIQIEPEFLGIPVGIYLDQIVGTTITGANFWCNSQRLLHILLMKNQKEMYILFI